MGKIKLPIGNRGELCALCEYNEKGYCTMYGYKPRYFRGCQSFKRKVYNLSEMPVEQFD